MESVLIQILRPLDPRNVPEAFSVLHHPVMGPDELTRLFLEGELEGGLVEEIYCCGQCGGEHRRWLATSCEKLQVWEWLWAKVIPKV